MVRRLVAMLVAARAVLACESVLGIDELSVSDQTATNGPSETTDASLQDRDADASSSPDSDAIGEDDEPPQKRVFVTSTMSTGILGGRKGADALCAAAAATGKLPGTWIAWLSQSGELIPNAIDRIPHDGPFYRLDGVLVAQDKARLASGTLNAPIITTETGALLTSPSREEARVWTGTVSNGTLVNDCNQWSSSSSVVFGTLGSLTYITNGIWTNNGGPGAGFTSWGCQTRARLYCFEL